MKRIKFLIIGVVVGLLIGLWFGINIGRDKPLLSNPFADESITKKAKDTADEAYQDTKRAIQDSLD